MGKKNRQREESWAHAKRVCRLDARQVQMAKKLGMNPKNLPRLVPSKSQSWKLPVGAFIEECYARRFGRDQDPSPKSAPEPLLDDDGHDLFGTNDERAAGSARAVSSNDDHDRNSLASDLVCHLANLQDDLERELADGRVEPGTLARIARDLRRVADEIEAGTGVSQMPHTERDLGATDGDCPF